MSLIEQLKKDEGCVVLHGRHVPYKDSVGVLTIGYGHNLDEGIDEETAEALLQKDLDVAEADLRRAYPWVDKLDGQRRDVLVNMTFNMGITRLSGFVKFLAALEAGDFKTARYEMLNSKWAAQVGDRAVRLAKKIWSE